MSSTYTSNDLVNAIAAASKNLSARKDEVNRLNVFPVPDGDTGTNMSLTLESVVASLAKLPIGASAAEIRKAITTGALMGARGNSGVITSQILRGLCEGSNLSLIHIFMDGHFVPNLTMGVPVVKQLKKITDMPLDVHLMISNPLEQLPWFLDAGADIVTVHAEAAAGYQLERAVEMIHAAGAKAAASVKPHTPVEVLAPVMAQLDMVLIMSVEPGFSGQSYIEGSERKVARTVELARAVGAAPLIEVDGGIGVKTAPLVAAAGADVLVCGSAVCGADDPAAAIAQVTQAAEAARAAALASKEA